MKPRDTKEVLNAAEEHLNALGGHVFDVLSVSKPVSPAAALNLAKVISKLSPLLGNLIEFNLVELLNAREEFHSLGEWRRQDPGFPDTIFVGSITPTPGIEIKAWFPLATEITARFRDSQQHFVENNTRVAMLSWLPEQLIYGRPRILDVCVVSAQSVAAARDNHYHQPPDYLVIEPRDTAARTRNLQQTNTAGYKWQGTPAQLEQARNTVASWGPDGALYKPTPEYQELLRGLMGTYPYRLDTNFAKMDRIMHPGLEDFKRRILGTVVNGMEVRAWARLLGGDDEAAIRAALQRHVGITAVEAARLVQ